MLKTIENQFTLKDGMAQTMKVPHVTIWFWIAKCCATTVGETISDFFNTIFDPCQCSWRGLGYDAILFFPLLFAVLFLNFKSVRYHPALYWGAIILCSICGTIVTDGFHDNLGVMLWVEVIVFGAITAGMFVWWYMSEGTLDIHSIDTFKREMFYWGTVIATFALGTAVGDCTADQWGIAFAPILGFFCLVTLCLALTWAICRVTGVIERGDSYEIALFWASYIMTRPVGASTGDLLGSSKANGGWGLGFGWTSLLFFGIIVLIVAYLMWSKIDEIPVSHKAVSPRDPKDVEVAESRQGKTNLENV